MGKLILVYLSLPSSKARQWVLACFEKLPAYYQASFCFALQIRMLLKFFLFVSLGGRLF